ncbi:MAG: 2-C-methyl-D-erythritol 4-phosphate cytidylyltransferase, partial [Eubacteriales bacterium]
MNDERAKQFIEIQGLPVVVRSAMAFQQTEEIHEIVVVTRAADVDGCGTLLRKHGITKLTKVIAGGSTRQESAKIGFDAVNPACDFVAIHDAARCLVTPDMIEAVFGTAYVSGAAACANMVVDTIKKT